MTKCAPHRLRLFTTQRAKITGSQLCIHHRPAGGVLLGQPRKGVRHRQCGSLQEGKGILLRPQQVELVRQVEFDALFTFIFSPRPGTPAAKMDDPVPRSEKQKWFDTLCAVQNDISARLHARYVGQTLRVLVDGRTDDARWPLSARTAGGRLVHLVGDEAALGQYRQVRITDSNTWALFGEMV